jgi:hypothetical protein
MQNDPNDSKTPSRKTSALDELIARARRAHESIQAEPAAALERAFEAGDALTAAKAQVERGRWADVLRPTGIPASTARLYMQLARERPRVLAAGCTSIREARRLLAGTKPSRPRQPKGEWSTRTVPDRYQEGYADGYRAGRADGFAAGQAQPSRSRRDGRPLPLDRKDLRWLVGLAHPDRHDGELRATRATQWLNELLEQADRG